MQYFNISLKIFKSKVLALIWDVVAADGQNLLPKSKILNCIEPSKKALEVAK